MTVPRISRQLGDILDVGLEAIGPLQPGSLFAGDKPTTGPKAEDYNQNKGKRIKINRPVPLEGRTNFTGILSDISLTVQLTVGRKAVDIQFADIVKANLVE
jgi:hypothetical protein